MFFQPNKYEKHTFFQPDHKKSQVTNFSLRKFLKNPAVKHLKHQICNNSNKENNITAIVDKASSYQHNKLYNKTLNASKSLCNNVIGRYWSSWTCNKNQ